MRREVEVRATRAQRGTLEAFLHDGPETRTVAIGGSRFLGKTWLGAFALGLYCLENPGVKCLALRKVLSSADQNMGDELKQAFFEALGIPCSGKRWSGGVQYLSSEYRFTFPNGSVIQLGYCQRPTDWEVHKGLQWDVIWFEQAEEFPERVYDLLGASNRKSSSKSAAETRILLTFNPGGPGAGWVQKRIVQDETRDRQVKFFPASVKTSYATLEHDPGYVLKSLRGITDPVLRKQWWDGDWDALSGVYFRMVPPMEGKYGTVVAASELRIPYYSDWIGGVDWGRTDPFCHLWVTSWHDPSAAGGRHIHVVDEVYQTDLELDQQVWLVLRREKAILAEFPHMLDSKLLRIADASTAHPMERASNEQSRSKADIWRDHGMSTYPSDRSIGRVSGWELMKILLRHRILTIDPRCQNLIREMKSAVRDERGEDISKICDDHALDSLRYVVVHLFPTNFDVPEDDPYGLKRRRY